MDNPVIQAINSNDDGTYQLLFQNVVSTFGMVLVGIEVAEADIRNMDIRAGDTLRLSKNVNGVYVAGVDTALRPVSATPYFPPTPKPKVSNLVLSVGPFDAAKLLVDLQKTLTVTVRGVMANAGVKDAGLVCVAMGEDADVASVAECVSNLATESA
jgi:hypothetical protein